MKISKILSIFSGILFLVSGLAKATDAANFANLMSIYGASWFGFGAPIIIAIEVIIGLFLIFDIRPKTISACAIAFVVGVSGIFLYGVCFRDITDCGCFGPITWLNTRPWLTFTRNAILVGLLVPSIFTPQQGKTLTIRMLFFMSIVGTIVMFMCGFSFRNAKCLQKESTPFTSIPLQDSPLSSHITINRDSTYLIFAFSYTCPYCQNSIGNIHQYISMKAADKVIGLAVEDTIGRARFYRLFQPEFEIKQISKLSMTRIVSTLPTTFYIRHDSIVSQYSGMAFSPAFLLE